MTSGFEMPGTTPDPLPDPLRPTLRNDRVSHGHRMCHGPPGSALPPPAAAVAPLLCQGPP